jgi:hypothetical protein
MLREERAFRFHAKLAGAEVQEEEVEPQQEEYSLAERLKKRTGGNSKPNFGEGVGYQTIGG